MILLIIVLICFTDQAKKRWNNIRTGLNRARTRIGKWEKAPSGSGARKALRPNPYKYTAELVFLDAVSVMDPTTDNLTKGDEDDVEVESAFANREVMHCNRFSKYIADSHCSVIGFILCFT